MIFIFVIILSLFVFESSCLNSLPHRARGGIAYQQHLRSQMKLERPNKNVRQDYFVQPLDHFDPMNTATFGQRYYVDSSNWNNATGPVFLNIGGEGPETSSPGGFIQVLGQEFGALLISLEHRFYGKSVPNNDMSTPNLQFLSTKQALADIANFIVYINSTYAPNRVKTFFTFGGSYSGALSAFFRLKYPHLTAGSLSSSGVVNAVYEFTEFDTAVFEAIGPSCAKLVQLTTKAFEVEEMAGRGVKSRQLFGMNPDATSGDFFYMMADSAAMADQYGHKEKLCDAMSTANPSDPNSLMVTFANFTNSYWGSSFGGNCFYDTTCLTYNQSQWQPTSRAWRWQKCSEMAYFQSAPSRNSLRSTTYETLSYDQAQCIAIFGKVIPNTNTVNLEYGGANIQGTNIFYSNFYDDPWHRASVRKVNNPSEPFVLARCAGCGHCQDFHAPSPSDAPELTMLRNQFKFFLKQWLAAA